MGGLVGFSCLCLFFAFIIFVLVMSVNHKKKLAAKERQKDMDSEILLDKSSGNAKVFREFINTPITVSENGEIGIVDPILKMPKIIHIKDIIGFELVVDGKNTANIGGAVVGGLLFGGVGAIIGGSAHHKTITKMNLLLKVNDFKNPTIDISLYDFMANSQTPINKVQEEVKELMATLEFVERRVKG